ncbi:hypothetical protein PsorP6_006359 [Peronosclerospora sorghi]|uniref:Uncharacterized protein n=1 Tax=Peronosclerospora sorghi TaxID=230839 RepID=A0ACC0W282_9STRA|nr:hypothetical protein PsorP6_006359 [Peronosclerospora sorghi]
MLQSSGKLKDDGDLFVALEEFTVRKQSTADVRSKLEEYVTHVCEQEEGYAHPLVILAIALVAGRLSRSKASDVQRKLMELFALHYPESSGLWLDDAKERLIKPSRKELSSARSVSTVAMSVEDKLESLKSQHGCRSDAMEQLLKLVGLKKDKLEAFNLFKGAIALQKLSPLQRKKKSMAFIYCFIGNPGTGKTTVARLFASVLKDFKIRSSNTIVECSAQKLKDDGAAEFRLKVQQASGGVIFIDEAYELNPAGDLKGKPIVAELLTAAEDKRDELSVIIAGYKDDIQKNLYAYNDGLQSRFHGVVFEDFDAQELEIRKIGDGRKRSDCQSRVSPACKSGGAEGIGNALAVRKLFEHAVKDAMAREDLEDEFMFQMVDLLGERPSTNPKLQAILDKVAGEALEDKRGQVNR